MTEQKWKRAEVMWATSLMVGGGSLVLHTETLISSVVGVEIQKRIPESLDFRLFDVVLLDDRVDLSQLNSSCKARRGEKGIHQDYSISNHIKL